MEVKRLVSVGVALCLCRVVLEGYDLDLELLVEQYQLFLLSKDVFTVKSHLLSLTIKLRLLFFHLFLHLVDNLEELVFTLL